MTPEHQCLPLPDRPCPRCSSMIAPPAYCDVCGEDISPPHVCHNQPLPHVCTPIPSAGRCMACGEVKPARQFCVTCGADVTLLHHCKAAPPTQVHKPDPVHRCPSLPLPKCSDCGEILPAMAFCAACGTETTPPHICQPGKSNHTCSPVITMPKRCSSCGELYPLPQHCARCGKDITPQHTCA